MPGRQPIPPMPQIPIIMPQLGESIAEATVVRLLVQPGDLIEADQDVLEVETNKATMNVAAPCRGRVERLLVTPDESYPVGAILGYLVASTEDLTRLGLEEHSQRHGGDGGGNGASAPELGASMNGHGRRSVEPTVSGLPVPAHAAGASYMSPRMKAR